MKRPSKKDIKAALDRLKQNDGATGGNASSDQGASSPHSLTAKQGNNRIRKKGV